MVFLWFSYGFDGIDPKLQWLILIPITMVSWDIPSEHFLMGFHGKSSKMDDFKGDHHVRKPPYIHIHLCIYIYIYIPKMVVSQNHPIYIYTYIYIYTLIYIYIH